MRTGPPFGGHPEPAGEPAPDPDEPTVPPASASGVSSANVTAVHALTDELAAAMDPLAFTEDAQSSYPEHDRRSTSRYWETRRHLAREHAENLIRAGYVPVMRWVTPGYWDTQPEERVRHMLNATFGELLDIERTLAAALGYQRSPGGPDDPNGGDFLLGDATPMSLALEAARKLAYWQNS